MSGLAPLSVIVLVVVVVPDWFQSATTQFDREKKKREEMKNQERRDRAVLQMRESMVVSRQSCGKKKGDKVVVWFKLKQFR